MREPEHYPESFDEMVELVLAGQKDAAGIVGDGTLQRLAESAPEDMEPLPVGE